MGMSSGLRQWISAPLKRDKRPLPGAADALLRIDVIVFNRVYQRRRSA
jgi:hypothetical protein